jgi:hypothetical protein
MAWGFINHMAVVSRSLMLKCAAAKGTSPDAVLGWTVARQPSNLVAALATQQLRHN